LLEFKITQSETRANLEIAALSWALIDKGLVTLEEVEAAKQTFRAGQAVEEALNPDIQAYPGLRERGPEETRRGNREVRKPGGG
jgi:hypothetical protein